ncbi:MAG TPA: folylpolyglutamate synthase/dihydrofolate synthase family protein [Bacillota bacterium]|nr:folylpolyglutamate synthase/dihydrofolate synthase family protein [Bacillota bacterium]
MHLEQMIDYIHRLPRMEGTPTLARMQQALEKLDHPDRDFHIIHVAGTNGKGSTCAILASILTAAGYRTGLFTSPFLDAFTNRVKVDGADISATDLGVSFERLMPVAEEVGLTQFEFITALGLLHFARAGVDAVVLEVGLGGRFDATNAISTPLLSVITNIGYDHMAILGDTLAKIAGEKAGIIRTGVPVITAVEEPSAWSVIRERCLELEAPVSRLGDQFSVTGLYSDLQGQVLRYESGHQHLDSVKIALLGRHQQKNAATALAAAFQLRSLGLLISDQAMRTGLAEARWPGRFEVMSEIPLVIMDGSHNTHGMAALRETLDELLPSQNLLWVAGMMADKDVGGMLKYLEGREVSLYACAPQIPRAMDAKELALAAITLGFQARAFAGVEEAISQALLDWRPGQAVLIAGSLYVISEARRHPFFSVKS